MVNGSVLQVGCIKNSLFGQYQIKGHVLSERFQRAADCQSASHGCFAAYLLVITYHCHDVHVTVWRSAAVCVGAKDNDFGRVKLVNDTLLYAIGDLLIERASPALGRVVG